MDGVGVLDTPSTSTGNSFSFLFTVAFHIFVFLGSCLSMIMLLSTSVHDNSSRKSLRD